MSFLFLIIFGKKKKKFALIRIKINNIIYILDINKFDNILILIEQENHRELLLENISFNEVKNLNLKKVQLKETPFLNQYLYEGKVIKFLNWELKPKINFLITYKDNNIILETSEELIKGLGVFSEIIKVKVKFNIFYNQEDSCKVQRSIILGLKKKPKFLKVIPDKIFKKLFSQSLELIAKRSDKRLLLTLSRSKLE